MAADGRARAAVPGALPVVHALQRAGWKRYGPRVQQAVKQELDAVLTRLEKGLPPAVYEQVLQVIASEEDPPEITLGTLERLPP